MAARATGLKHDSAPQLAALDSDLPALRCVVVVVVDGLGHSNLKASSGHARTISSLPTKRIETVIPSTTGAALTSLTTGSLPGRHGLIGYKIRHPKQGLVTTLKDWHGIEDRRSWQRVEPIFGLAAELGVRPVAIGRPAHATGGLTEAILTGAEYHGGQTIADRFSIASRLVRSGEPTLAYLYVDELDKVAHRDGWQSEMWVKRLEQLDTALGDFLQTLPGDVGVVLTADHGMVDVPPEKRLLLDEGSLPLDGVDAIGGEPRMRSLYLKPGVDVGSVSTELSAALGKTAWVGERGEAVSAGWFGPTDDSVAERLGEVLVAARGQYAFQLSSDPPEARSMVGQHGGLSDDERGVPLVVAGGLVGSAYAGAVTKVATALGG